MATLWLNLITTPDKYPLPNMQDLSNGLHGCKIFSKVDLIKGYHQIPVAAEDIPKTAITRRTRENSLGYSSSGPAITYQLCSNPIIVYLATRLWSRPCRQTFPRNPQLFGALFFGKSVPRWPAQKG